MEKNTQQTQKLNWADRNEIEITRNMAYKTQKSSSYRAVTKSKRRNMVYRIEITNQNQKTQQTQYS